MLSAHKEERVPKRQPKCVFACTTFLRLRTAYTLHTCTAVHRVRRVVGVCSLGYVVLSKVLSYVTVSGLPEIDTFEGTFVHVRKYLFPVRKYCTVYSMI